MNQSALENLRKLICKYGLEQYTEKLLDSASEAVGLSPISRNDEEMAVGESKFGGRPDVPKSFEWPTYKGRALSFIAQIDLTKIGNNDGLPHRGILSFFYDVGAWGYSPDDRGTSRVYYFDEEPYALERRSPPEQDPKKVLFGLLEIDNKVRKYKSCALVLKPFLSLPDAERCPVEWSEAQTDKYYEMLEALGNHHRLLGHAEPIQGEMELQCQLVTNGLNCGDSSGYLDPRARDLEKDAHQWKLLLQIDTEDSCSDMMWGDCGRLYFWIKETDLKHKQFGDCWLISQCC